MAHAPNWQAIPSAPGDLQPAWPLPSVAPKFSTTSFASGRPFGCAEGQCERWHAGIDLRDANAPGLDVPDGTIIVAPEAGTVVGVDKGWDGPTKALYLSSPGSGLWIVMGGLKQGSPAEFGIAAGTDVTRGQPLGRVRGAYGMIHLETYGNLARTTNSPWYVGSPPPADLLNPTTYVQSMVGDVQPQPQPDPLPQPPPKSSGPSALAIGVVALVLGAVFLRGR